MPDEAVSLTETLREREAEGEQESERGGREAERERPRGAVVPKGASGANKTDRVTEVSHTHLEEQ